MKLDRSVVFPALHEFFVSPGTKPDLSFAPIGIERASDLPRFKSVPDSWTAVGTDARALRLDQDGFRVFIEIKQIRDMNEEMMYRIRYGKGFRSIVLLDQLFVDKEIQASRLVAYETIKTGCFLHERRYVDREPGSGALCIELTVVDDDEQKRTLGDLLAHLRKHYSEYEGVCQHVVKLARPEG